MKEPYECFREVLNCFRDKDLLWIYPEYPFFKVKSPGIHTYFQTVLTFSITEFDLFIYYLLRLGQYDFDYGPDTQRFLPHRPLEKIELVEKYTELFEKSVIIIKAHDSGLHIKAVKELLDGIWNSPLFFDFINICYAIISLPNSSVRQEFKLSKGIKFSKPKAKSPILCSNDGDILEQIKSAWKENQHLLVFDTVEPLAKNADFLMIAIKEKIRFTSLEDAKSASMLSESLLELSEKLKSTRGGNPKAGKNTKLPANEFARKMGPKLDQLDDEGYKTLQSKADILNEQKIKTLRGKSWTSNAVRMTWLRWQELKDQNEATTSSKSPKPE